MSLDVEAVHDCCAYRVRVAMATSTIGPLHCVSMGLCAEWVLIVGGLCEGHMMQLAEVLAQPSLHSSTMLMM